MNYSRLLIEQAVRMLSSMDISWSLLVVWGGPQCEKWMMVMYKPLSQSYRMHLKSENGAIDVLVCPEDEPQCLQSPRPPPTTAHTTQGGTSSYSEANCSYPSSSSTELIPSAQAPPPPTTPAQLAQPGMQTMHSSISQLMHQQHLPQQQLQDQQQQQHHLQQSQPQCLVNHHQSGNAKLQDGCMRQQEQASIVGLAVDRTVAPSSYPQVTVTGSASNDLDISLSSAAEMNRDDLGFMDQLLPLDMGVFDHLSPTLNTTEDFSFSLHEDNEGIQDLFDI